MSEQSKTSSSPAGQRHRVQERVRWGDVDAAGIIYWGAYVRFVEIGETELFRAIGYPYASIWDRLDIWLPRVQFHCDFRNPVRLDDLLGVETWVGRLGRSSIRFEFAVRAPNGELAGECYLVVVAVDRGTGRSVEVPKELVAALAPYRADSAG